MKNPKINYKLFQARREAGLTQAEIAAKIGMDRGKYCYIESNRWNPSEKEKQLIADGLGIPVRELFSPAGAINVHEV